MNSKCLERISNGVTLTRTCHKKPHTTAKLCSCGVCNSGQFYNTYTGRLTIAKAGRTSSPAYTARLLRNNTKILELNHK